MDSGSYCCKYADMVFLDCRKEAGMPLGMF